jgi:SAM-dependent methyltransferase
MVGCRVEPDLASRRIAAELGVRTDAASLDDLIDQRREFDLVLLSHVLEHVVEPEAFLSQVLRVLSPQGMLIIEVPNGLTNESLHLFHPYLYTRRALTTLLAHHGLAAAVCAHGGASSRMRRHYLLAIARRADGAVVAGSVFGRSFGRAWSRAWKRSRILRRIDGALVRRMVVADERLLALWAEVLGTVQGH